MKGSIVALVLLWTAGLAQAQSAGTTRFGVWGGATIYAQVAGTAGIQISRELTGRFSVGARASIVDFIGPCNDPDPVLNPDLCIADGRLIGGYTLFRTGNARRRTEPYVEGGLGLYNFAGEYRKGTWAPYVELGIGLQVSWLQIGLRYMRVLHGASERDLGGAVSYLSPIIGVNW